MKNLTAMFVAIMLVSAAAFASVCDLSCQLHQSAAAAHTSCTMHPSARPGSDSAMGTQMGAGVCHHMHSAACHMQIQSGVTATSGCLHAACALPESAAIGRAAAQVPIPDALPLEAAKEAASEDTAVLRGGAPPGVQTATPKRLISLRI